MATTSSTLTAVNSFNNTPQAVDDTFYSATTGLTEDVLKIVYLDVMANDRGGAAKTLYAIDNGIEDDGTAGSDLLIKDTARAEATSSDTSAMGAKIWITSDGKVGYDATTITNATFLAKIAHLGAGESITDTFTYSIRMANGTLSWATATVVYSGQNDGPAFAAGGPIAAGVTEDASTPNLTTSGNAGFTDVDWSDHHTLSVAAAAGNTLGGALVANVSDDSTGDGTGTVSWNYTVDNTQTAIQQLGAGDTVTETFTITVDDGHGGTVGKTVTVTVTGVNDEASITGATNPIAAIVENADASAQNIGATTGTITVHDADVGDTLALSVTGNATASLNGGALPGGVDVSALVASGAISFDSLTSNGGSQTANWTYDPAAANLDWLRAGDTLTITYTAQVNDGSGAVGSQPLVITITGTNDAATFSAHSDPAAIDEAADASAQDISGVTGSVTVHDADLGDALTVSVTGDATITYSEGALPAGVDVSALAASAAIGFDAASSNGSDQVVGWTYDPAAVDLDWLAAGETLTITYTAQVDDGSGAAGSQAVTVTITGTNDAPTITLSGTDTDHAERDETDSGLTADGTLTIGDVDHNDVATVDVTGVSVGGTGSTSLDNDTLKAMLSVDGSGAWSFDSGSEAFDNLATGETLVLNYTVQADDGDETDTHDVTITITGTNDAPTITLTGTDTDHAEIDETDAGLAANGTLTVGDVDHNDVVSVDVTGVSVGGTGSTAVDNNTLKAMLSVDDNGAWSFDSGSEAFNNLAAGETLVLTYTVEADDGDATDTHDVTITITGTNDTPTIDAGASDLAVSGDEDAAAITGDVAASDPDHLDTLVYSVASTGPDAPAHGTVSIDANTGAYSYTPAGDYNGSDSFVVTVTDGHGESDEVTVNVTVDPVNDAPTLTDPTDFTYVDTRASDNFTGVSGTLSASDIDSATLTYSLGGASADNTLPGFDVSAATSAGTMYLNTSTGAYYFEPNDAAINALQAGSNPTKDFIFSVSDGSLSASQTLTVHFQGENDGPSLTDPSDITYTDTTAVDDFAGVNGTLSASDVDDATLTYNLFGSSADNSLAGYNVSLTSTYGKMFLNTATGAYHFEPNDSAINAVPGGSNPVVSFSFYVDDGHGGTATQSLDVRIIGASESPASPAVYNGTDDPNDKDTGGPAGTVYSSPSSGANNILGTNSGEEIHAGNGADVIYGLAGDDNLSGDSDTDTIYGGEGNDIINGGQANDILYGGSGNDTIHGDSNLDTIIGGYGADTLTGDANPDTFVYLDVRDTGDTITDFVHGTDKIDLSAIDANTNVLNDQAFSFVAADTNAVVANSVTYHYDNSGGGAGVTHVWVDVNGDATADLQIDLTGNITLTSSDFIL